VRFIILAPVCLVLWLLVLPYYAWGLAYVSEIFLKYVLQYPIMDVTATAAGYLNTGTKITFELATVNRSMPDVGHLTTNLAPFVALVLATSGLRLTRRLKILAIGTPIILLSHALTVILRFTAGRTPLPTAIGFISITLPFLLWIVLAYWGKISSFLQEPSE
jgi:hypothetical protein